MRIAKTNLSRFAVFGISSIGGRGPIYRKQLQWPTNMLLKVSGGASSTLMVDMPISRRFQIDTEIVQIDAAAGIEAQRHGHRLINGPGAGFRRPILGRLDNVIEHHRRDVERSSASAADAVGWKAVLIIHSV
jgi:hypothetical protein